MKKLLVALIVIIVVVLVGAGAWALRASHKPATSLTQTPSAGATSPEDATYVINGEPVTLVNGSAEAPAAPGSASQITTKYFGNDLSIDLNGDGRMDDAFILTQDGGGSGTFYYAVAALNTAHGYVGSSGYFLGDRIAPQATTKSPDGTQAGVVVFNYADRTAQEPMSAAPSVGKSVSLKLDPQTLEWSVVASSSLSEPR